MGQQIFADHSDEAQPMTCVIFTCDAAHQYRPCTSTYYGRDYIKIREQAARDGWSQRTANNLWFFGACRPTRGQRGDD